MGTPRRPPLDGLSRIVRPFPANIYTDPMYEVTVERTFSAAHAISIAGAVEPLHGHNWQVRATIAGETLDHDGLLCDFHTIDDMLTDICNRFHNGNLNAIPPFDQLNPTAELVARHIADHLSSGLGDAQLRVASVSVGEAAGCVATFRPGQSS